MSEGDRVVDEDGEATTTGRTILLDEGVIREGRWF
jgi:hypothetical protein